MSIKSLFSIFIVALFLFSCSNDSNKIAENTELIRLKGEVRALKLEKSNKDSLLNESIAVFNEIQSNLAKIANKENEIRIQTENPKLNKEGKQFILQEIRNINFLRQENASKIKYLNAKIAEDGFKMDQMQLLINRLTLKVRDQEQQINALQDQLATLDKEYAELLDAYQEQTLLTLEALKDLNRCFYVSGSLKELVKNNVVVKKSGYIGEATSLKDGFNEDYFTEIDRTKTKKINVVGKKIRFITDHPSSSYQVVNKGSTQLIYIKNSNEFWKISKYLVVVVE